MNKHGDHDASCLCCKHCKFEPEPPGYSSYTPGESAHFYCYKNHFPNTHPEYDDADITVRFRLAETCEDFAQRENRH